MTRKILIGVGGATALLALAAGGYMATTAGSFDSERWKAQRNSAARENPRAGMLGNLKDRLRPGMTRDEVVALLGEPEAKEKEDTRYVYDLGASAFGVDYEYYVVEFDADGKVVRHAMTRG
jgi:hypothetical protein